MDPSKTPPPQEAKLHFLDYWRIIRIRKAIIITVFLITAIIATAVTFILPEQFASSVRIIVQPDVSNVSTPDTPSVSAAPYDPYFLQTTYELIQSEVVLSNVVSKLNLNTVWGKKYFGGETLKTTEAIEFLKERMHLDTVRNTKYLTITVYSDDKNDAANLANAVAQAYQDYRQQEWQQLAGTGIDALQKQFDADQEKLQAVQTEKDNLRKTLGITDNDPNALGPTPTLTQETLQRYNEQEIEQERLCTYYETELKGLKAHPANDLRNVIPRVEKQETALPGLLDKLNMAEQNYAVLTNDYATNNLEIARLQSDIDVLNQQIDDQVRAVIEGLEIQVTNQEVTLTALSNTVESAIAKDNAEALPGHALLGQKTGMGADGDFPRSARRKNRIGTNLAQGSPNGDGDDYRSSRAGGYPGASQQDA